jgi:hypothetical protein
MPSQNFGDESRHVNLAPPMRLGFPEHEPAVHLGGRFDDRDTPAEYVYPTLAKRHGLSPSETPVSQYEDQGAVSHRFRCVGQAINLLGGEEPTVVVEGQRGQLHTSRRIPPDQPLVDSGLEGCSQNVETITHPRRAKSFCGQIGDPIRDGSPADP